MDLAAFRRGYKKALNYPHHSQPPVDELVTKLKSMGIEVRDIGHVTKVPSDTPIMRIALSKKGATRVLQVNREHVVLQDSSADTTTGVYRGHKRDPRSDVREFDESE